MRNIGLEMKERRISLRYTQTQIADYVGVTKGTVAKWESGFIDNIKRDKIEKLSQILKVSPIFFISDDYNTKQDKQMYYLDNKVAEYAQEIANNNELEKLVDLARGISKEDMELVFNMIKRFRNVNSCKTEG